MAQVPPVPQLTAAGFADPVWARWLHTLRQGVMSVATNITIATANGFAGTTSVDTAGNINVTLDTTVTGVIKGVGGALEMAVPGVDYLTGIAADAPLHVTTSGTTTLSITQADAITDGYVSSTDWNTFNNKLNAMGVTDGSNAAAGIIGEYMAATSASTALTTATTATLTSLSLTAGDWDVEGSVYFSANAGTVPTILAAGVSTTAATLPAPPLYALLQCTMPSGAFNAQTVPMQRISITVPTTVYLAAQATFTVSTLTAIGNVRARRVR